MREAHRRAASAAPRDLPERDTTEQAIRRQADLLEQAHEAILAWRVGGGILYWNRGARELYGYSTEEALGRCPHELLRTDRAMVAEMTSALERDGHWDGELCQTTRDGRPIWVDSRDVIARYGGDAFVLQTNRCITERKRAEAALAASEERYRAFVHCASEGIWRVEAGEPIPVDLPEDGQIARMFRSAWLAECNEATARMYGYDSPAELEGQKLHEVLLRSDPRNTVFLRNLIRNGYRIDNAEVHEIDRYGNAKCFLINLVGIVEDNVLVRAWGTQRDITERERAEDERRRLLESEQSARAEAERVSRVKDEFLATLSHELRTPLTAIVGWTDILKKRMNDPAAVQHGLEVIARNARAQARMVDDLLDLSRIISGKMQLQIAPVDLPLVIESAVESVRFAAEAKDIRIHTAIDPGIGRIRGEPGRLQQVMWNLLSNAIKFTPPGGEVAVSAAQVGSSAELTVRDTGQGIRPECLPHIFERFRQADASITRKYGGLGLGLSIVRAVVELHGGRVRAESPGEGQGSTFTVTLPAQRAGALEEPRRPRAAPALAAEPAASALHGLRVLVVDDDADSREVVKEVLEDREAEVTTASSAAEALAAIERYHPDVLVSDIAMPGQDGFELIRNVRGLGTARGGDVPAAALSALARAEDRRRALECGYQRHVRKPVDSNELVGVVAELAGRPAR